VGRPVALAQVGYSFTIDSSKSSVEGGLHVSFSGRIKSVKLLRYIELKSGYADNGPAWIGFVTPSKSGRTLYFNGDALTKFKGQRRGCWGGNYAGYKGEYWVSGVKKNGEDRHIGPDRAKCWWRPPPFPNTSKPSGPNLWTPHVAR